jgi:hypothetical protein
VLLSQSLIVYANEMQNLGAIRPVDRILAGSSLSTDLTLSICRSSSDATMLSPTSDDSGFFVASE